MGRRIEFELQEMAEKLPQKPCLVLKDQSLSYQEVVAAASELAGRLLSSGVGYGDRVAIFQRKSFEQVVSLYACWFAGAVPVPIDQSAKPLLIDFIIGHSGSKVLISHRQSMRSLKGFEPKVDKHIDYTVDTAAKAAELPVVEYRPKALGSILYTSGSTGRPKGVAVSHDNLVAGARIVSGYLSLREEDRLLSLPPFSFDYGLNQLLDSVHVGATLVLQRSPMPTDICRTLQEQEISVFAAVPTTWGQLLEDGSPFLGREFPALRILTNTGGHFPTSAVNAYREALPHAEIFLMYGLTEAFRSTFLPPSKIDDKPGSIGMAIPECEIHVVRPDGTEADAEENGELVHSGPTVSLGYWEDREATDAKFRPHPLKATEEKVVYSGDIVRKDADGYLYFVARADSMLKCFGHRVSPDYVEELLHASGLITHVVIEGVEDEIAGKRLRFHVEPRQASFEPEELDLFVRQNMPSYMMPISIEVYQDMPRTTSGKLDRKKVIADFLASSSNAPS